MSKYKKLLLLLVAILHVGLLFSDEEVQPKKVILLTIPKSGTHLLQKVVGMITGHPVQWMGFHEFDPHGLDWADPRASQQHLSPVFDEIRKDHSGKYIKVIMIRDLRDTLISQSEWMVRIQDWVWVTPQHILKYHLKLSPNDRLKHVIAFPDQYFSIKWCAQIALQWMKEPDVFVCRFEDLVGERGGGTQGQQRATIQGLAKHLGYTLTEQQITYIADNLFGGTGTFREGQIGSWQQYFNAEHKQLFKQVMGAELINLGYEHNNNW